MVENSADNLADSLDDYPVVPMVYWKGYEMVWKLGCIVADQKVDKMDGSMVGVKVSNLVAGMDFVRENKTVDCLEV